MTQFFIGLYDYFERHKILFYLSLISCVLLMGFFALQVRFEENITQFFPDTKDSQNTIKVFDNLKIKDKIIIMLSSADTCQRVEPDSLIEAAGQLQQTLTEKAGGTLIKGIFAQVDQSLIGGATDFVYEHLPLFLTDTDYQRFDSLLTEKGIQAIMQKNYTNLLSPAGIALRSYILRDPLGLGSEALKHLQDFQLEANYEIYDEHIFSKDGSTLLMFITPVFSTGSTGKNDELIKILEEELQHVQGESPTIRAEYFGGPSVGVYNARQIKKDTILTSSLALLIIIVFISLVFKRKRSIPLIITPVLFGGLFALFLIFFIKGSISAIAVGAGSAVMGIALSYSIHMLAHQNHVSTVQQLIKEIAYPLTVGSFTTIGAFLGLIFTSSDLLRDFGLFASLALVGTTLFCLIYLPHFLKGQADVKQGRVLRIIEKINAYSYEKNKWLVGGILLITVICFFTSQKVGFNNDMMSLNYEPQHLKQSEEKLMQLFDSDEKTVLFVSVGKDMNQATETYAVTNQKLLALKDQGLIKDYASASQFLISPQEQQLRLKRWKDYWTDEKQQQVREQLETAAAEYRFRPGSFDPFYQWLNQPFGEYHYAAQEDDLSGKLLNEWQTSADSITMLISQIRISDQNKETVYQHFSKDQDVVIFDRSYFANKWVSAINDDFYLILYISSFLIFFALWFSYGRIELTLMSFLPMLVSWVIILGLMGILGIEFNIINIILSTFIFGIGDDFSIFIMDGLQNKYRTGQKVLNSHKTAIFFSAFTTVVGMGALVFAKHPALQSISLISILGMIAVVLVAYTIQPLIFRFFIAGPASKGLPPYTLIGLIRTVLLFLLFFIGCIFLRVLIAVLYLVPVRKSSKQRLVCRLIQITCKGILLLATAVKKEHINKANERFQHPAIIIANHQSFIDILVLLSLSSKILMVTNHWVWHSPFFGAIIRYVDFYYIGEGYEQYMERMRKKVKEGYSIAIFPEGTRTYNGKMKRFHKGAFYLAETLQLDILPILLYGNNKIIAKAQPFNIRKGIIYTEILPRIPADDLSFGTTYQERTKRISAYMKEGYARICREKNTTDNPAFYEALIQNYIYKGPVVEWYIRIKVKMERNYRLFNRLIPVQGQITDIGCGFGPLCYMLSMLSEDRDILGIDYDEDKIALAQHGWLRNEHLQFRHGNALEYPLPESDVFILNDMLHYMSYEHQRTLLLKCADRLRSQGMIIIRDGNSANTSKHRLTRFTELLSTRIFNFNRTAGELHFTTETQLRKIAVTCGMNVEIIPNDKYTSNTIYIFRKPNEHE
ncbi:1-acyl-sn-glycerol-3-phosphate acyltransferase [Bacteroides xylanisolvens]|jgi:1-acyl-sn-glycerol-3-phosphate acyltransferase|uniref:1-acyl-sn-glycerol-3-phosphate acyltransferase n=1 Tax=Bacteroides xylanisolvens TaxID=371601 RepID=A0AAW4STK9_9BACE|nr:1-acyl-sn-glycerol-3-phosphate acyltransferase [Bacteroides xylanisolvens]MCA4467286.1 1-acyl-sn-glycerol-3-phosphate acyltransferase [Bacteroides xylanisolvens]MCA4471812.1 1-acyl-sn-glycerol-3-phosphate acyltransferase [Bacteroides xylanisolvens]MCA4480857.1 1-acyl-sn-glycerol-3-phosphate acyltransferase [Bacteroides xylanisolvens]MCA4490101.1 1-acyl-sn-glycerol-3-phosphate acyltransferase [Bacteroides xylanisolvens]MCA4494382.1 1-acyl-sn-glycerol-3-phosphate acyltransferase [Bacteroides 